MLLCTGGIARYGVRHAFQVEVLIPKAFPRRLPTHPGRVKIRDFPSQAAQLLPSPPLDVVACFSGRSLLFAIERQVPIVPILIGE